jgi:hypothetical protein
LGFVGSWTGNYIITKSGAGAMYFGTTAGGMTVNSGKYSGLSCAALILANTAGVIYEPLGVAACTTANLGGANARVEFAWNSGMGAFFRLAASSTVALANVGLNFTGSPTNGVYDLIVASGTMSGTLPTIQSNTTGKTLVLSQVGNTLKVTVS